MLHEHSYDKFKKQHLSILSEKIGRLFYATEGGDDIPDSLPNE